MNQTFDWWQYGVPVIIPQSLGDFSTWAYEVPVVEIGASSISFTGTGISGASVVLAAKISKAASGTGIATASVTISALVGVTGSGTGIASASAVLGAIVGLTASGSGISIASAILSGITPPTTGASRRASPRQSTFQHQDYAAHGFSYRRVDPSQEKVRHIGD